MEALVRDDVAAMREVLQRAAVLLGPRAFVTDLAHPLALRVGEAWERGDLEIRHEHLMSDALSTQLRVLRSAHEPSSGLPIVVLATLPGEQHGLGLQMIALYLAVAQALPRVLGTDTPVDQIVRAARAHRAGVAAIGVSGAADRARTSRDLRALRSELPRHVPLWIGGATEGLKLEGRGVRRIAEWSDLDAALRASR
jgi:methanogenic corrinoid protein MtbC1